MDSWSAGAFLFLVAAAFAGVGIAYSRGRIGTLEDYITARGTVGALAAAATLVASGMGAWILFGPAEAATGAVYRPSWGTPWGRRFPCWSLSL